MLLFSVLGSLGQWSNLNLYGGLEFPFPVSAFFYLLFVIHRLWMPCAVTNILVLGYMFIHRSLDQNYYLLNVAFWLKKIHAVNNIWFIVRCSSTVFLVHAGANSIMVKATSHKVFQTICTLFVLFNTPNLIFDYIFSQHFSLQYLHSVSISPVVFIVSGVLQSCTRFTLPLQTGGIP